VPFEIGIKGRVLLRRISFEINIPEFLGVHDADAEAHENECEA